MSLHMSLHMSTDTRRLLRSSALALAVLAPLAGCGRKKVATPAPQVVPAPTPTPTSDDSERLARERAERERAEREAAARARREAIERTLSTTVLFGFDRYDLTADARTLLEAKWTILRDNPSLRLRLEGHADDLGSDEYNLALGMQRAAAVKRFFSQRDIPEHRLEIVSFGEEQPTCTEGTDGCRAMNRRAEFRIITGLDAVAVRDGS
ncbi:MAG: OmpA family protein [Gemmatimonadota bacterium]